MGKRGVFPWFVREAREFLAPVTEAVGDPRDAVRLGARVGWNLEPLMNAEVEALATATRALLAELPAVSNLGQELEPQVVVDRAQALVHAIMSRLLEVGTRLAAATPVLAGDAELCAMLADDLCRYLWVRYLARRHPAVMSIGQALGVICESSMDEVAVETAPGTSIVLRAAVPRLFVDRPVWDDLLSTPLAWLGRLVSERSIAELGEAVFELGSIILTLRGRRGLDEWAVGIEGGRLRLVGFLPRAPERWSADLPLPGLLHARIELEGDQLALSWSAGPASEVVLFSEAGITVTVPAVGDGMRGWAIECEHGIPALVARGAVVLRIGAPLADLAGNPLEVRANATLSCPVGGRPTFTCDVDASLPSLTIAGVTLRSPSLRATKFSLPPGATQRLAIAGTLGLPGGEVSVRAEFGPAGVVVSSSADLELVGGLRLRPVDGAPVLVANVSARDELLTFEAKGQLDVPAVAAPSPACTLAGRLIVSPRGIEVASMASASTHTIELPGGISLARTRAEIALAQDRIDVRLEGDVAPPGLARPVRVAGLFAASGSGALSFRASADIASLSFHEHLWLSAASLTVIADLTSHAGRIELRDASGGFVRRPGAAGTSLADYELGVSGLSADCGITDGSFSCSWNSGSVLLPPLFSAEGGARAAVSVDPARPLELRTSLKRAESSLKGALAVSQICLKLGEDPGGVMVTLERAELELDSAMSVPAKLSRAAGSLTLSLVSERPLRIGFSDVSFRLDGLPEGELGLREDITIALGDAKKSLFTVSFLAARPGGTKGTRLRVARQSRDNLFTLSGDVRATFAPSLVADIHGGEISIDSRAELCFSSNPTVAPRIEALSLEFAGAFRLGDASGGLLVRNGKLAWRNIERIFGIKGVEPMELGISGDVELLLEPAGKGEKGPALSLLDTRFRFDDGPLAAPKFITSGMSLSTGKLFFDLFKVERVGFKFFDPGRELPQLLSPGNLRLVIDAIELNVAVDAGGFMGKAEGLELQMRDGLPSLSIRGVSFGVDNLELPTMKLSGALRLSGFRHFPQLKLGGVLGGSASGTGVRVLYAHDLGFDGAPGDFKSFALLNPRPLGAAFDVSGGAAGIPVYNTGILITGASGGVSFAGKNVDPTDFVTYLDTEHQVPVKLGNEPTDDLDLGSDRPTGTPDCTCDCPPPAMNVFCQPHPDPAKHQAILKFSSLDEAFLERTGLRKILEAADAELAPFRGSSEYEDRCIQRAEQFADKAAAHFEGLLGLLKEGAAGAPLGAAVDDNLQRVLQAPGEYWKAQFIAQFRQALAAVSRAGTPSTLYAMVRDLAAAGVPCPDVTLQVTGTVSYAAVSSYLSVTGGINVSTSGSVGVIGYLNLLGLRLGRLRGFLTFTSAQGDPDPNLCGDLRFVLGPLDLGSVNLRFACPGFIADTSRHVVGFAEKLGGPLVRRLLQDTAGAVPGLLGEIERDPALALSRLGRAEVLGLITRMLSAMEGPFKGEELIRIERALIGLSMAVWGSFHPEVVLCGQIAPKLFGLELAKLASLKGWATKTSMGLSVGFSPLALLACVLRDPTLFFVAHDSGTIAVQYELPGVDEFIELSLSGRLKSAADAVRAADLLFERFLSRAALTFTYELSPLGMKLLDVQGRVLFPDLASHPATPHSGWRRPEARGLRPRADVLLDALAHGRLADAGWSGELSALYPDDAAMRDERLLQDYFPHGGFLGAAAMVAPRALTQPLPLETVKKLLDARTPKDGAEAALELLTWLGSGMERVGYLYFYVPAPNPPTFAIDGRPQTPRELARQFIELHLPPGGALEAGSLYSAEHSLLGGRLSGTLLGVPVAGGELTFVPPDGPSPGSARVRLSAPADSWIARFFGPLDIIAELRLPSPGDFGPVTIEAGLLALRARLASAEVATFSLDSLIRSLSQVLPRMTLEAKIDRPDKIALPGPLTDLLRFEKGSEAWLRGYGPGSELGSFTDPLIAQLLRFGGLVFQAHGRLSIKALDIDLDLPRFTAVLEPRVDGVRVRAELAIDSVPSTKGLPPLRSARLVLDSHPPAGGAFLVLEGRMEGGLRLGKAELHGLTSAGLGARVVVGAAGAAIEVEPAELRASFFSGAMSIRVHGETQTAPFRLGGTGEWDASLTLQGRNSALALRDAANNEVLAIAQKTAAITGRISGKGLSLVSLALTLGGGLDVVAFPRLGELAPRLSIPANSSIPLDISADGSFKFSCRCRPLRFGIFVLHGARGVNTEIDISFASGSLTVRSGAAMTIDAPGFGGDTLPLESLTMSVDGTVDAKIGAAFIDLTNYFRVKVPAASFIRKGASVTLQLESPSLTLFRGTPLELSRSLAPTLTPSPDLAAIPIPVEAGPTPLPGPSAGEFVGKAIERLQIDGTGRFHVALNNFTLSIPGIFTVGGSLAVGYLPRPAPAKPIAGNFLKRGKSGAVPSGAMTDTSWVEKSGEWRVIDLDGKFAVEGRAPATGQPAILSQTVALKDTMAAQFVVRGRAARMAGSGKLGLRVTAGAKVLLEKPVEFSRGAQSATFEHRFESSAGRAAIEVGLVVVGKGTVGQFWDLEVEVAEATQVVDSEGDSFFGPYAWLRDASFKVGPELKLPGTSTPSTLLALRGDARITAAAIEASLAGNPLNLPPLLEVSASAFDFRYETEGSLAVTAKAPRLKTLGYNLLPKASFRFDVKTESGVDANLALDEPFDLVPGVLRLGKKGENAQIDLCIDNTGAVSLRVRGLCSILPTMDGPSVHLDVRLHSGRLREVLFDTSTLIDGSRLFHKLLPLNHPPLKDLIQVNTGEVVLTRDEKGSFALKLENLGATLHLPSLKQFGILGDVEWPGLGVNGSASISLGGLDLELELLNKSVSLGVVSLEFGDTSEPAFVKIHVPRPGAWDWAITLPSFRFSSKLPWWKGELKIDGATVTPSHGCLEGSLELVDENNKIVTLRAIGLKLILPGITLRALIAWGVGPVSPQLSLQAGKGIEVIFIGWGPLKVETELKLFPPSADDIPSVGFDRESNQLQFKIPASCFEIARKVSIAEGWKPPGMDMATDLLNKSVAAWKKLFPTEGGDVLVKFSLPES